MRKTSSFWLRLAALLGALALLFVVYRIGYRSWFLRWGATDAEVARALPGDEVVPRAAAQATRAITIHAPIAEVWPWLTQVGRGRGGFYSYEVLEDLVGADIDNADRILPGRGDWKAGDKMWMYPPDRLDGMGHAQFVRMEPGRALVFATRQMGTPSSAPYDGTWSFVLTPVDGATTRLLVRGRGSAMSTLWRWFDSYFFAPAHFAMERRMMLGIKQRAEGQHASYPYDVAQVSLWTAAFALLVTAAVLVLRRRQRWLRALVAVLAAGLVFQLLTLVQPHVALGALLVLALVALLWLPVRRWGFSAAAG